MARATKQSKQTRRQYSAEYKTEALALAARVGVPAAAGQLGLHESQLYAWRGKDKREQGQGEAERQLAAENARLKRQLADQAEELAIVKKAAAYFAKGLK
jgi:transposase